MTQPPMTKESQALLSSLAAQRNHVLGILEGLSEEDLQRPILPSRWTCAGLVNHLAIDVERFWFRAVVADEPMPDDEPDNAWQVPADLTATAVLDAYRREIGLADAIIAATSLDSPPAWWPDRWQKTCLAAGGSMTCARSSCMRSPRQHATPVTSTRHVNSSTDGNG